MDETIYADRKIAELLQKFDYYVEDELSNYGYYIDSDKLSYRDCCSIRYDTFILAPLLSEIQQWLRDEHDVSVEPHSQEHGTFNVVVKTYSGLVLLDSEDFGTYEDALKVGIRATLENLEE